MNKYSSAEYKSAARNVRDSHHEGLSHSEHKSVADMLEYAAHLAAQDEWPSDEDVETAAKMHMVVRGLGMLSPWETLTEESRIEYRRTMRAAQQSVRSPVGVVSSDPIGWVFQHEDTGRMCFCENDGINTPEVFAKNNPRHSLVSPAYSSRHAPTKD